MEGGVKMKEKLFLKQDVSDKIEKACQIENYEFKALKRALKMDRDKLIEEIKNSGLKGRGGAGFPTGVKWELGAKEKAEKKYMICNADEGEPGTFKDRYLLEYAPFKVLEGIVIAAYAVEASEGFIYIRGEYANSIAIFQEVIDQGRENNILGNKILDSECSFDLGLIKGAGAYVCGDETSLLNSIEGERGQSRIKPPYPVQKGLFGFPTVVNNVETLATAAEIAKEGSSKYTKLGTSDSRGTKLVSLSGDVNEPGVYEIEFGEYTIEEIVTQFGGGVKNGGNIKFVIPGGISTSILPPDKLDTFYTYEDLEKAGSSLGSGAMIVVSDTHDTVDLLSNVAKFYMDETCGTCFPCREGNRQIYHLIEQAKKNNGFSRRDMEIITDVGKTISLAARCGLGQSSLNFVQSVLDNFQDEVLARGEV